MKNRKNIFVYIIFAISVIYGLYFHLVDNKGKVESKQPVIDDEVAEIAEIESPPVAMILTDIPDGWGSELFRAESDMTGRSADFEAGEFDGLPRLTAISFYLDNKSFAIINNKIVQEGEIVAGWRVQAIEKQHVLIKNKFGVNKLILGEKL